MRVKENVIVNLTELEILHHLFQYAFKHHYSIAVWQLPLEKVKHIILSRKSQKLPTDTQLEELEAGFVIAPFDKEEPFYFLKGDYHFKISDGKLQEPSSKAEEESMELLGSISNDSFDEFRQPYSKSQPLNDTTEDAYLNLVSKGLAAIEKGDMEKIVPSRTKSIELPSQFNYVDAYLNLSETYPNAFVSFVSSPEIGTWMGATPEELVRVIDKIIFKTVALAGTKPYHTGINIKNVAWTQKEIEEQALVERYIISCFKKIRLREYDEHGPKTVVAGNVMHLKSDFTVNMKETGFPQLGSIMLRLLHPTSAVCGMPLEPALQFLKTHEGYDRQFYSGFLGPVNVNNRIDIFVNLRCTQFVDGNAVLYAGAGVTEGSVPEDEFMETEMKMKTLLRVIQ
jgi:isochorismate synthase